MTFAPMVTKVSAMQNPSLLRRAMVPAAAAGIGAVGSIVLDQTIDVWGGGGFLMAALGVVGVGGSLIATAATRSSVLRSSRITGAIAGAALLGGAAVGLRITNPPPPDIKPPVAAKPEPAPESVVPEPAPAVPDTAPPTVDTTVVRPIHPRAFWEDEMLGDIRMSNGNHYALRAGAIVGNPAGYGTFEEARDVLLAATANTGGPDHQSVPTGYFVLQEHGRFFVTGMNIWGVGSFTDLQKSDLSGYKLGDDRALLVRAGNTTYDLNAEGKLQVLSLGQTPAP